MWRLGKSLRPATRDLALLATADVLVVHVLLVAVFGIPLGDTVLGATMDFFAPWRFQPFNDSWRYMIPAFEYARAAHQEPLYQAVFFEGHQKFQYPPTSLLVIGAVSGIARLAGTGSAAGILTVLNWLSWVAVLLEVWFVVKILEISIVESGDRSSRRADELARSAIVGLLVITYCPVMKAYAIGQIQIWLDAMFAAAVWLWLTGRAGAAGTVVGLMTLVKPQYSLIVVWGILRRRRRFATGAIAAGATALALSIALFGLRDHLDYLGVLSHLTTRGELYYRNQSINGLLNRWAFSDDIHILVWQKHAFPPFHAGVYLGTLAAGVLLVSLALWRRHVDSDRIRDTAELLIVALTATIASPIAWEHHYGILPPIFAFLYPHLRRGCTLGLAAAYCVSSLDVELTNRLAHARAGPLRLNLFQSYLLFAALAVLALLYTLAWATATHGAPDSSSRGEARA